MLKMQNEMEALKNAHESFKTWAQKQIRIAHQDKIPRMEEQLKEHEGCQPVISIVNFGACPCQKPLGLLPKMLVMGSPGLLQLASAEIHHRNDKLTKGCPSMCTNCGIGRRNNASMALAQKADPKNRIAAAVAIGPFLWWISVPVLGTPYSAFCNDHPP